MLQRIPADCGRVPFPAVLFLCPKPELSFLDSSFPPLQRERALAPRWSHPLFRAHKNTLLPLSPPPHFRETHTHTPLEPALETGLLVLETSREGTSRTLGRGFPHPRSGARPVAVGGVETACAPVGAHTRAGVLLQQPFLYL